MFPDTSRELEEEEILGFGFMVVYCLKQPRRGLGPSSVLNYTGLILQSSHKDKSAYCR